MKRQARKRIENPTEDTYDSENADWRISKFCDGGACVAVAIHTHGGVKLRNSKDASTILTFTKQEWTAFIQGVKHNEFDIR